MLLYPARSRPLDTFEDVVKSDLGLAFRPGSAQWEFLTTSTDEAVRALKKRVDDWGLDFSTRWASDSYIAGRIVAKRVVLVLDRARDPS